MNVVVALVLVDVVGDGDFAGVVRGERRMPAVLSWLSGDQAVLDPFALLIAEDANAGLPLVAPRLTGEPNTAVAVGAHDRVDVRPRIGCESLFRSERRGGKLLAFRRFECDITD